jgi:Ca2+-binding RTX toxin-like protein
MSKGTKRNDKWRGTSGTDVFLALAGNDLCIAGGGNDRVSSGAGNDTILGGAGNDNLIGGDGDDDITGGAGNDRIDGGAGDDTLDGGSGNDLINGGEGNDTIVGGSGRDRLFGGLGDDNIAGDAGNDTVDGGDGNDFLDGGSGFDTILGGLGDDQIEGGDDNDLLDGGDGNDDIAGNKGDDRMIGGLGDDVLDWDDGDGSDIMSGNDGTDTIEVDGSVTRGDNFVLSTSAGKAFFQRVGLDGQAIGQFSLTVDTAEIFDVSGDIGNDTFIVNDVSTTGVIEIQFEGGAGNDVLDGRNTTTHLTASGGEGDDWLIGGTGTVTVPGPNNTTITLGDTLTGGTGRDKFQFSTDPFAGGVAGQNLNRPDVITDYEIGIDQLVFDRQKFGIDQLQFQKGQANLLQNGNLLVLEGVFANAGLAAQAVAANNAITAEKGIFIYHNSTLGISRAVFSQNLANGGPFSVQANLTNLTNAAVQTQFTQADFALV